MINHLNEKIKTNILFVLVILSFVQAWMLWNSRTHGLKTNFIDNYAIDNEFNKIERLEKLISPKEIVYSKANSKTQLSVESTNKNFESIWGKVKVNFSEAITGSEFLERCEFTDTLWSDKYKNDFIEIVFSYPINAKLLDIVFKFGKDKRIENFEISRMIFFQNNDKTNHFFIGLSDLKSEIYFYEVNLADKKNVNKLITDFNKKSNNNVLKYNLAIDNSEELKVDKNSLGSLLRVVLSRGGVTKERDMYINMPFKIYDVEKISNSQIRTIKKLILGVDFESYEESVNFYNEEIVFSNGSNIYRITKNGSMIYHYLLESEEKLKTNMTYEDVLNIASNFIFGKKILNPQTNLKLEKFDIDGSGYLLRFAYEINGVPVEIIGKNRKKLYALELRVNNSRVITSKWMIRNLYLEDSKTKRINMGMNSINNALIDNRYKLINKYKVYSIGEEEMYKSKGIKVNVIISIGALNVPSKLKEGSD